MVSVDTQLADLTAAAPVVQRTPRSAVSTLVAMFGITLLSKGLGFLSQILVTSLVGTSGTADSFYFASSMVSIVSSLVIGTVGFVLIPCYVEKKEREGIAAANAFANGMLTYLFLVLALLSALMAALAGPFVNMLGRFPAGLRPMAIRVFAASAPLALLTGMGQLLMVLSQARRCFVAPAFMGVIHSIVFIIVVLAAWKRFGVYALILAVTASALLQAIIMLRRLAAGGMVSVSLNLPSAEVRKMLLLSWPLVVSQVLLTVQVITTRSIASGLVIGSVAALAYAEALKCVFLDLCVVPVAQISLPRFSERIARKEDGPAWEQLQEAISGLWFLVVPVVVLLLVLSRPLVQLFYQRGAFTTESTTLTASALAFFSLGLLGESVHYLVSRYFIALKDIPTLTWLAIPFTMLYFFLIVFLSRSLLLKGIALGHSMVAVANMVAALWILRIRLNRPFTKSFGRGLTKIIFCGLIMLLLCKYVFSVMSERLTSNLRSCVLQIIVVGLVGAGSYLATTVFVRITTDIPMLLRLHPRKIFAELIVRT